MFRYLIRRLLQAIPTLFGISIISFILISAVPGDPVMMRTFDPKATEESREILRKQFGLDQSAVMRYFSWVTGFTVRIGDQAEALTFGKVGCTYHASVNLTVCNNGGGLLRGDLGTSWDTKQLVWHTMLERMPATLTLGIASLLLSLFIGIPLGVLSAVYHRSPFDYIVRSITAVLQSVPVFYIALFLILIFSVILGWLPSGGMRKVSLDNNFDLTDRLTHLILPAVTLALGPASGICRLMRTESLEVISQDYIRTAKSKGLSSTTIWFLHALRNSLIPLMTVLGPAIVGVLGGAVVTETIFAWQGMGRLTVNAVFQRDFPIVLGSGMVFALLTIIGNLLSDIFYAVADPRVRLS